MRGEKDLSRAIEVAMKGEREWLRCMDCDKWYGAEDDEYGPCLYKNSRKEERFVTHGGHYCDEVEELRTRGLF